MTEPAATSENASLPEGFRYAGVACGIKESGKPDLSLVVCDRPVTAAGVYTQCQVVAAPVVLCRSRTPSSTLRAVVTNSGNANACTGDVGMSDAQQMCRLVANVVGCDEEAVLVMSTGVIGHELPMDRVSSGIEMALGSLGSDADAFDRSADAILTTDKGRKTVRRSFSCGDKTYSIAAMAKGAGMISPNMATMLALVLTDAPLSSSTAQDSLTQATGKSFNRVSVDGHMSTNDTVLLLASGEGESLSGDELAEFQRHVDEMSIELAKMLVADGEGASHVMAIQVRGAENERAAETIARTVAASPLVKTAITGADPNWGRIVSAAGYAEAKVDPALISLKICGTPIYDCGSPKEFDAPALSSEMKRSPEILIELQVGKGPGNADFWASDLTVEYVRFNSEYTT